MRTLAVIAHDHQKADLVAWATFNRELMQDKVGLAVEGLLSGPEGGDAQIAALVATGDIDAVYFFVDPLSPQPHDPDIRALLRVCNVHNVPLATNLATADLVMASLADERVRPAAGWASPD